MGWESKNQMKQVIEVMLEWEEKGEEVRQQLNRCVDFNPLEVFERLDEKHNGFLTPIEFRTLLDRHGVYVSSADLNALINIYDTN